MNGTITDIHNLKWGNGSEFRRVTFKMEDGSWAKTDLCPTFRNFEKWKHLLKVGVMLSNLRLKDKKTVDADIQAILHRRPPPPMEQAALF